LVATRIRGLRHAELARVSGLGRMATLDSVRVEFESTKRRQRVPALPRRDHGRVSDRFADQAPYPPPKGFGPPRPARTSSACPSRGTSLSRW
jgi:hypothetical protein